MIAEAAASAPWLVYEGEAERADHPLLALLRRPNPRSRAANCWRCVYGFLLIAGNAYVEAACIDGSRANSTRCGPTGCARCLAPAAGPRPMNIPSTDNRLRLAARDGAAPANCSTRSTITTACRRSKRRSARSIRTMPPPPGTRRCSTMRARPSGALVYAASDGHLTPEQFERLKERARDEAYQGAANAGRPLLLEGGLDWKEMGFSPRTWISSRRRMARRAISRSPSACRPCCSAFRATIPLPIMPRPTAASGGRR